MKQLTVQLEQNSYPIYITNDLLKRKDYFASLVKNKRICIVSNPQIADYYLAQLKLALDDALDVSVCLVKEGESEKNLQTFSQILDHAVSNKLNRSSLFVALGGGVIGDMVGFAAACFQRGVGFIQIPTTLLSQVDSSVGGKTAINHPQGKNLIGAFHQPKAVFIDIDTLNSLNEREFSAGIAEVIKYGLILDADFFVWLEANMSGLLRKNPEALTYAISRSCQIKAEIVALDEKESTGVRALLNLGHTFGHAIETLTHYGVYLHGEAIAVGMLMAVSMSVKMNHLPISIYTRLVKLLQIASLPIHLEENFTVDNFLSVMAHDKKNIHGQIRLILLKSLGKAYLTDEYSEKILHQVISEFV